MKAKKATRVFVGLPLLPDGTKGEQALYTEECATLLRTALGMSVETIDERYSSMITQNGANADAQAACSILMIGLEKKVK